MRTEQEIQEAIDQIHDRDLSPILIDAMQWVLGRRSELNDPRHEISLDIVTQGETQTSIKLSENDVLELENTPHAIRIESIDLIESRF